MPYRSVLSPTNILFAFLGGLAGAAVFAVLTRGSFGGLLLSQLSPLPVMIVALGMGPIHGATAALTGAIAVTAALGQIYGMSYGLLVALPGYAACYAASGAPWGARDLVTRRFPAAGVAALCAAVAFSVILFLAINFFSRGRIDEPLGYVQGLFFTEFEAQLKEQKLEGAVTKEQIKEFTQFVVPAMISSSLVLLHAMNLWIAGRLTQVSGMLRQAWPDIAAELKLPRALAVVFLLAFAATFLGGFAAEAAFVIVAVAITALGLQGLAVIHYFLRGSRLGVAVLTVLYFATGALLAPLFLFAIIGLLDMGLNFRDRKSNAPASEELRP